MSLSLRALALPCLLSIGAVVSACSADPDVDPESSPVPAETPAPAVEEEQSAPLAEGESRVNGKMLEQLDLGSGHVVQFYELEDGDTGVYETRRIEDGRPLLDNAQEGATLEEIYELVLGDGTSVPDSLRQADLRSAHLRATASESTRVAVTDDTSALTMLEGGDMSDMQETPKACAADLYGDNYGGQWFLNNYCNEGAFRSCLQNRTETHYYSVNSSWLKWEVMAADFNHGARMYGGHHYMYCDCACWFCAGNERYREDFNFPVQPRHVGTWLWTTKGKRDVHAVGDVACRRVHNTLEYNK